MSSIEASPPGARRALPAPRPVHRAARRAGRRARRPPARPAQRPRRRAASPCSPRPASPASAASSSAAPGSSPDCEAAFCATVRLTSLEPKICPSTSLPRLTSVGFGASTSSSRPPPPSWPSRPPSPSRPAGCACACFLNPPRIAGASAAAPAGRLGLADAQLARHRLEAARLAEDVGDLHMSAPCKGIAAAHEGSAAAQRNEHRWRPRTGQRTKHTFRAGSRLPREPGGSRPKMDQPSHYPFRRLYATV